MENEEDDERVTMSDAMKFPIYASIALATLYILFKNLDKDFLNFIFKAIFAFLGTSLIGGQVLRHEVQKIFKFLPQEEKVLFDKKVDKKFIKQHFYFTTNNLASYAVGAAIGFLYFWTGHWTLNNILGISFSIVGIMYMKVSNYRVLSVLLWLLFAYDIFMVFKSDLMVTVAKNLDAPIKLVLPSKNKPSMIGLGDIVLPGILVAWALKFDIDKAIAKWNEGNKKDSFTKPELTYFWTALVAYMLGIVSTFISMVLM